MKKPSVVSFLITLMFLLAAAVCTHGQEPVRDTAGNSLETGQQYFIQPVKTDINNGGGLVPAAIKTFPLCPLGIVQALFSFLPGQPLSFQVADSVSETVVATSTDVTIEFQSDNWPFCKEFSKFWAVGNSSSAEPPIIIGGEPERQDSRFKIEKAGEGENTYKLTSLTGTIGTVQGLFGSQLALTNDDAKTIVVKFKKFDAATTAITPTSRIQKLGLRMFPFY